MVNDPKHSSGGAIGRLTHDIRDEAVKRKNAFFSFTSTGEPGPMNIQGSNICPCTTACVFVFKFHRHAGLGRIGEMTPTSCLNTGFFIRRHDKLVSRQGNAFPHSCIDIQNASGFLGELGIMWEYPGPLLPGFDSIFDEPGKNSFSPRRAQRSR